MKTRHAAPAVPLALLLLAACAAGRPPPPTVTAAPPAPAPRPEPEPEESPPVLQLPEDVRPVHAALELVVIPSAAGIEGTIAIEIELARARRTIWLHGRGLEVTSAVVEDGGAARKGAWRQVNDDGLARLDLEAPVGPGKVVLRLAWRAGWSIGAGLYRWKEQEDWYAATQFEAAEARRVFPGFDEPSAKIPWEVAVTAPAGLRVVGNTPELGSEPAGPGLRRVRFAATRPLPSYLLFLAVGPYDVVEAPIPPNEVRAAPLPQRGFAPKGRGAELAYGLEASSAITAALERWFGFPFPYEKLDHVVAAGTFGAMENAGAIRYEERFFLFAQGQTPEARRRTVASFVAHEVAHQWFGDLVTLRWWTDTWLNESFATWIEPRARGAWRPAWRPELGLLADVDEVMRSDGLASARAIRQPLERMSDIWGQFDGMAYQKGAGVIGMFERWAGPEPFRAGVRRFLEEHRDGTATTADFLRALSAATGRDLGPAFSTFLDQPGVPLVTAEVACAPAGAEVRLRQTRWQPLGATPATPARWEVPLCVRGAARGRPFRTCTLLESPAASLPLPAGCPDWLLPNAEAAGYFRFAMPTKELTALLVKGLPRLGAAEKVALLGSLRAAHQAGALPAADLLAAASRLAVDADAEVVLASAEVFLEARRVLEGDPALSPLESLIRRLYRPRLDRLGWTARPGEPDDDGKLRPRLLALVALTGRDPAVRAEAARRGARFLGLDGKAPDASAISADLSTTALQVAIEERGALAFDAAWSSAWQVTASPRRQRLVALQALTDPTLVDRAGSRWRDPVVPQTAKFELAVPWAPEPAQARALLARLEREYDEVRALAPEGLDDFIPEALTALQTPGDAARVRALFEPRLAKQPGMARPLAQTLEQIAINAAARARKEELAAAVRKAGR